MGPLAYVAIVVVCTVVAVGLMLLVRRHSPAGGHFADGDRAAGFFGVLATGFAILLGLVVVLAFQSYDDSRAGAEDEARTLVQQYETAQFLPVANRAELSGALECYGRAVVHREWPLMEAGDEGDGFNPWGPALFGALQRTQPESAAEQAAYARWLDQTSEREDARYERIHGASGVVPAPLWVVLLGTALVIFGFMLFFADSGEGVVVQGFMMGSVVVVMVSLLCLISALDQPFRPGLDHVRPVAMERSLDQIRAARLLVGAAAPPCDAEGRAR